MRSLNDIYEATSPVQTTFDYSLLCLMAECDPVTFKEASEESKWNKAMDEEIDAIRRIILGSSQIFQKDKKQLVSNGSIRPRPIRMVKSKNIRQG